MEGYSEISNEKKIEICSRFILDAPPGEFSDVYNGDFFNLFFRSTLHLNFKIFLNKVGIIYNFFLINFLKACRVLVGDDMLLKKGVLPACKKYNEDQFTPIKCPDGTIVAILFLFVF